MHLDVCVSLIFSSMTVKYDTLTEQQLRRKVQTWLSIPDPSISHDTARKSQHGGTTRWFIKSRTFRGWKENASLLWIRGKRTPLHPFCLYDYQLLPRLLLDFAAGAGKTILWSVDFAFSEIGCSYNRIVNKFRHH
jgi:hypothetical protein